MDDWFSIMATGGELPTNTVQALDDVGFVVVSVLWLQRTFRTSQPPTMQQSWPRIPMMSGIGKTSTRVHDFVNRGLASRLP